MQGNKPISPSRECRGCQGHVVQLHNDEKVKRGTVVRLEKWPLGFGHIFRCAVIHGVCGGSSILDICS